MPASTSLLSLTYPVAADAPAGHTQMQTLAEDVEAILAPQYATTSSASAATVSGTYAALANSPSLTIPTTGTWEVIFGALVSTGSTAGSNTLVGLKIGAAAILDEQVIQLTSGNATSLTATLMRMFHASITASTALTIQARAVTSAGNVDDMYISARLVALP